MPITALASQVILNTNTKQDTPKKGREERKGRKERKREGGGQAGRLASLMV